MATYSPSLKITLLEDGEQSGTWGQTQNRNLGTLLEQAITGVVSIVMSDADYTMTDLNGVSDEARNAVLVVTGTNNAVRDVIAPQQKKLYTVYNGTTGGYAIRIRSASGSAVTIPNGMTTLVYTDGLNFYSGISGTSGSFSVTGDVSATGNVVATGNVTATGSVAATGNVTAAGNVVAVTAFSGPGTGLTGTASSLSTGKAANIVGGAAYSIPYQTGANVTTFLAAGTSGYILQTNGAGSAPAWVAGTPAISTTNFWVGESGGNLVVKYGGAGGTTILTVNSSGNVVANSFATST